MAVMFSDDTPMAQSSAPQGRNLRDAADIPEKATGRWMDRARFKLCLMAARPFIRLGNLAVGYQNEEPISLGDGTGPYCVIRVDSTKFLQRAFNAPDLALGEAFMAGEWRVAQGDLTDVISHLHHNDRHLAENPLFKVIAAVRELTGPQRVNTPDESRANVAHHYDIGNDLYSSFLDEGMNYSCAFFESPDQDLRGAQINKLRTTISRLDVKPGMSVLDIGSGWGELTRMIAQDTDADQVTGITLAKEQYKLARERAGAEFGNRLHYALEDYRDHANANPESYDRIVSIGMFEHVGKRHFQEYFQAVQRMLKSGGQALIHSIIRPTKERTSPWVDKYIFPGGCIPLLSELVSAGKATGLKVAVDPFIHNHTNYATTLRHWRKRFNGSYPSMNQNHYDTRFHRMWNFYLAGSEAAFDSTGFSVAQVLFRKNV